MAHAAPKSIEELNLKIDDGRGFEEEPNARGAGDGVWWTIVSLLLVMVVCTAVYLIFRLKRQQTNKRGAIKSWKDDDDVRAVPHPLRGGLRPADECEEVVQRKSRECEDAIGQIKRDAEVVLRAQKG